MRAFSDRSFDREGQNKRQNRRRRSGACIRPAASHRFAEDFEEVRNKRLARERDEARAEVRRLRRSQYMYQHHIRSPSDRDVQRRRASDGGAPSLRSINEGRLPSLWNILSGLHDEVVPFDHAHGDDIHASASSPPPIADRTSSDDASNEQQDADSRASTSSSKSFDELQRRYEGISLEGDKKKLSLNVAETDKAAGLPVPVPPKNTGVEFQKVGTGDTERSFLVPTSHVMITKAHRNDYRRLKRFEKLLRSLLFGSGNRFRGSPMHRRILGLFLAQAPYAGGETVEALMAGTRAGFASELIGSGDFKYGKNVSLAAAAFGSPSKATLSRIVLDTAADIKLLQMVQIKEGNFINAHLTGDGGSRAGMKHFPKLLSAFHKTKKRVEEMYVDNCQSGETADDIARHIKHSLEPYVKPYVKIGSF